MFRQLIIVLGIIVGFLMVVQIGLYFRQKSNLTVTFKGADIKPIRGEVTKKDKYIIVKPAEGGEEQIYTWDQVQSITGDEPSYNKTVGEVTDSIDLIAKLGVLAAAGVFLIGLYQFNVGQTWKREEFLANMVNDFGRRQSVENAKKMLELLMFYKQQGRKIDLYPERQGQPMQHVTVAQIEKALDPAKTDQLDDDEMRIRECFDSFLSRLERFEHYIENDLAKEESVEVYLGYWINTLIGKGVSPTAPPTLERPHREMIMTYAKRYEFPMIRQLLHRYEMDNGWRARVKRFREKIR